MKDTLVINSNGQGVQSKCSSLLMYEKHPAMKKFWKNTTFLDVFADTQGEPDYIYEDIKVYEEYLKEHDYPEMITMSRGSLEKEYFDKSIIPTRSNRHCTDKFKIRVIRNYVKKWLEENDRSLKDMNVIMLIGITRDESHRVRDSDVKYIKNEFPLIYEMEWYRSDCIKFLDKRNLPHHKSGCWYCPFLTFTRFYDYVENKVDKKEFIIEWENKALKNNERSMFYKNIPISKLIENKEKYIRQDVEDMYCDSGYCFT